QLRKDRGLCRQIHHACSQRWGVETELSGQSEVLALPMGDGTIVERWSNLRGNQTVRVVHSTLSFSSIANPQWVALSVSIQNKLRDGMESLSKSRLGEKFQGLLSVTSKTRRTASSFS